MTTHFEEAHFDHPEELYVEESELKIQFSKLNHRQLFKNYLKTFSQLKHAEELSRNLIAKQAEKRKENNRQVTSQQKMELSGEKQKAKVEKQMAMVKPVDQSKADVEKGRQIVEDQVSQKRAKSKVVVGQEDIIAFDYSSDKQQGGEGKYNPFLPKTYNEQDISPSLALADIKKSKHYQQAAPVFSPKSNQSGPSIQSDNDGLSVVNINAQVFSFKRGPAEKYQHFEIRPDYSETERWDDQGSGQISIQKELNSQMGIVGASLYGPEIMDTKVDLVFERGMTREINLPVFYRDEFAGLFSRKKFSKEEGILFIELADSTESVDLDTEYEEVIYLNRKLQQVSVEDDYNYILFIGVTPGSTTLEYIRNGFENLKKVVLIESETIYYDFNEYMGVGKDVVQIKQRNMLGIHKSDLNIKGDHLTQFNSYEKISQVGPSRYDLTTNVILSGTRKYVELSHMSSSIYLGRWDAEKVVIPSEDYIAYFLKTMELDDLSESCLVQVNFKDKVKELFIEGKNGEGYIPIDQIYIDAEGEFSKEVSPLSVQGFFLSNQTGVLSFKIGYENEKQDYFNSYCASSTYIIEQL